MNPDYTEILVPCSGQAIYANRDLLPIASETHRALCRAIASEVLGETTGHDLIVGVLDSQTGYTFCFETESAFTVPVIALIAILQPVGDTENDVDLVSAINRQLLAWLETTNGRAVSSGEGVVDDAEIPLCFSAGDFAVVTWEGELFQSPLEKIATC